MTTLKNLDYLSFRNPELLDLALTHKSFSPQAIKKSLTNNERLEFLGDAVLDLILSDLLMSMFPEDLEGDLTKKRASLVNEQSLFEIAQSLGLDQIIKVGKAEKDSGITQNPRILASCLEAVLGALFLDQGYEVCKKFLNPLFESKIQNLSVDSDYKTRLQELSQKNHQQIPEYVLISTQGPEHQKIFEIEVRLIGKTLARGVGRSKKLAEQEAAKLALEELNVV